MHKLKNKFLQLVADNKQASTKFEIVAQDNNTATIYLYDVIDEYFGIGAKEFNMELAKITANEINLRINSPGGDVFQGRAMQSALIEHEANIIVHIDGLAASAATTVALAGNDRRISQGGMFMIHKGWTMNIGNADDFAGTAALLNKVDNAIAKDYAVIAGITVDEALDLMAAETWYTDEEALAAGFVSEIKEGVGAAQNRFDLSAFSNAPMPKETEQDEEILRHYQKQQARLELVLKT